MLHLFDKGTASVLAEVLPLLLISLMVEFRRVGMHTSSGRRRLRLGLLAAFYLVFGLAESGLVLYIDDTLFPLRAGDVVSAVFIFGLLALLFALSTMPSREKHSEEP